MMSGLGQAMLWKVGAAAFAVVASAASFCAYQRSTEATALRDQLAGVTADLNRAHEQVSALTSRFAASQTQVTQDQQQLASVQQQVTQDRRELATAQQQVTNETTQLLRLA